jgi:hypothetical protein
MKLVDSMIKQVEGGGNPSRPLLTTYYTRRCARCRNVDSHILHLFRPSTKVNSK